MFDLVQTLLVQLINVLPFFIPFVLIMNLCSSLLWGENK